MSRAKRVYKVGGPALEDPKLVASLAKEIGEFSGDIALVHGGGRQVERLLEQLGIESKFIDGRRETSPAAMEIVEMVLTGSMNTRSVASSSEYSFGVSPPGGSGGVRPSAGKSTRRGPKAPRCSHTDAEPGPLNRARLV